MAWQNVWPSRRRSKYGNRRVVVDSVSFDSVAEARRAGYLKLLEAHGEIRLLVIHPVYDLEVNGIRVCHYEPDFRYETKTGAVVVEDVKSPATMTPVYRLKAKLLQAIYGIEVQEVSA